jgi:hypothetical protein
MSFILDALRKSESERQRDSAPSLVRLPLARARRRTPVWTWLVIGVLALALAAVSAAWWFGNNSAPGVGDVTATESPRPVADSDARATPLSIPTAQQNLASDAAAPRPIDDLYAIDPALPRYRLTLLQFNRANPAAGAAWIDGTRYDPGQRIDGGPELQGVRSDGAVLAYRGQRFLLTAR